LLIVSTLSIFLLVIAGALLIAAPEQLPTGAPKTSISDGEYKVASVYVAGENVNLILEIKYFKAESPFLYQFPLTAFDGGQVNQNGKKLTVVTSGNFRKLKLE